MNKNKNIENTLSYKIGFGIGRILVNGLINAPRSREWVIILYGCLGMSVVVEYMVFNTVHNMLVLLGTAIVCIGAIEGIREHPLEDKKRSYELIFEEINLKYANNIPEYIGESEVSYYALQVSFYSIIPLNMWLHKKQILETYMNQKILDITTDLNDNRITNILLETNPLPTYTEWNPNYTNKNKDIIYLGFGHMGFVGWDLEQDAHGFVTGQTGSGKSNIIKCIIYQAQAKNISIALIDFKRGVSFSSFQNIQVNYEFEMALESLNNAVQETKNRLDLLRNSKVDNIIEYNKIAINKMKRKLIIIDELAELLQCPEKQIHTQIVTSLETLTRLSRAVGIHVILGLQRVDSQTVSSQIKNNVSMRIVGKMSDPQPSRIMLGTDSAYDLPDIKGRFIAKSNKEEEFQAFCYVSDSSPSTSSNFTDLSDFKEECEVFTENVESGSETQIEVSEKPKEQLFDFSDLKK